MPTQLDIGRDVNGAVSYFLPFSDRGQIIDAPAGAGVTVTIPEGYSKALFQFTPGATVLTKLDNAVTPPSATWSDTTADINPAGRSLIGATTIWFYPVDAAIIKISYYI